MNQWTVLAAMIPIVYSIARGEPSSIPLQEHRVELLLTLLQSALGVVILANFDFHGYEALGAVRAVARPVPGARTGARRSAGSTARGWRSSWSRTAWRPGRLRAFPEFVNLWRLSGRRPG